jgi:hypothetical protein
MALPHDPWEFFAGNTWNMWVTCGDEDGDPINISSLEDIVWVLNSSDGSINYRRLTVGNGITIVAPVEGEILIKLTDEESTTLDPGVYRDQCTLYIGGDVSTQTFGVITVKEMLGSSRWPGYATLAGVGHLSALATQIP